MAAKAKILLSPPENKQDITRNLPSLTFESALEEEELLLLYLRQQSHAHTTLVSATCAYLAHILNETRQIRADLARTSKQRRAIQLLTADTLPKDPLKVGIIGCGRLGTHVANSLLAFGGVHPADLYISTRRPETLGNLKEKGVSCVYDNVSVASTVHILFISVLPSQFSNVIEEIYKYIHKDTLIYCLVNHTTAQKLNRTLRAVNILIPSFEFDVTTASFWNSCMSIEQALEDEETVRKCCPLSSEGKTSCVRLTDKWVELIICAFINHCTDLELTTQAALDLLHGICIGMDKLGTSTDNRFTEKDFIINWDYENPEPRSFPKFDLSKIHSNDSHVVRKLRASEPLQEAFVKKFSSVFRDFSQSNDEEEDEVGNSSKTVKQI